MKTYVCKYCGKRVVEDLGLGIVDSTPALLDHLMLKHDDKSYDFKTLYISDIPKKFYMIEERA